MRRTTIIAALALALAAAFAHGATAVPYRSADACQFDKPFPAFARATWDERRWRRGAPKASTFKAERKRLSCATTGRRAKMAQTWRKERLEFRQHRAKKLEQRRIDEVTPYGAWAIPGYIVSCESGGDFRAYNPGYEPNGPGSGPGGAYQIIQQTWYAYGGGRWSSSARYAPPLAQHIVAGRIWDAVGTSAWACA